MVLDRRQGKTVPNSGDITVFGGYWRWNDVADGAVSSTDIPFLL